MSAEHHSIVITGGGIAGLAAAVALGRRGHKVLVAEKRVRASEVGAGLQISPNASHILLRWGLGPALAETAVAPTRLVIRRWAEPRSYAEMPLAPGADGAPFWVLLRADLHEVLRRTAQGIPGVAIRESHAFDGLKAGDGPLRLRFVTGSTAVEITADAAVGADGHWSRMRKELGDSRSLDPAAWEAWRTLIPADRTPDFIRAAATNLWLGRDSHAVHYPVAGGRLINLVVIRRSGVDAEGWDRTGDPKGLADIAGRAAPTLKTLMGLAPAWSVWTVRDRMPSVRLAQGPLALVGDAAHPLLPFLAQGAALAIEDAEVLAQSMPPPAEFNAETASRSFEAYARERAARAQRVFEGARQNAFAYHLPAPLAWFRDMRIASLGPEGMRRRYGWLYDWRC